MVQIVEMVMQTLGVRRRLIQSRPVYLRWVTKMMEALFPVLPVSIYWLDYLSANRTTALETIPRVFSLMPARMSQHLEYLRGENWSSSLIQMLLKRRTAAR
jgi:hypothetical protein